MASKRDQIILATRDLIFEQGLQDISMSQIAQRADVGMGTIYNYFSSKEELVISLYKEIKTRMSEHILDGYHESEPIVTRFLSLLTGVAHYGIRYPREFRLTELLAKVPYIQDNPDVQEYPLTIIMYQLFNDAQEQRLLKDLPPHVIGLLISGALNALVEAHTVGEIKMDDTMIEQVVSACWDAIKR